MTTEEQLPDMNIPNLGGTIVEDDVVTVLAGEKSMN